MQKKSWTDRFVDITPRMAAQAAFVFIGENAEKTRQIKWPATHVHHEEPRMRGDKRLDATTKVYLFGMTDIESVMASFRFADLAAQMIQLGAVEAYVEWTFMRRNARAVCARASEDAVWGFGRPHPRKPNFKPHADLAGPLVDYRPSMKEGWVFEPVVMKVLPSFGEEYAMVLASEWSADQVAMVASDATELPPHLAEYRFSGTGGAAESPSE
ncbi:MAG: hypothetical protein HYW90_02405 [Candidatus Sungbacteria bacterium]|nr:hypothetical protein [Candidatus Sungbacteria bacterium]